MASNPPGKCCLEGFYHEGEAKGKHETIYGVETYITGSASPSDKVIVIFTDIYGIKLNNALLVADQLAEAGYKVYVPDILDGDIFVLGEKVDFASWLARHTPEVTNKIIDKFMAGLISEHAPKFIGGLGYCFGAKFAVQQLHPRTGTLHAAAIAHPSFVSMEELEAIGKDKPLLISAAQTDQIFSQELRHASETKLIEIGATFQIDLFSHVSHGFAARGDVSDPNVKYAKEKALQDQICWFNRFSSV